MLARIPTIKPFYMATTRWQVKLHTPGHCRLNNLPRNVALQLVHGGPKYLRAGVNAHAEERVIYCSIRGYLLIIEKVFTRPAVAAEVLSPTVLDEIETLADELNHEILEVVPDLHVLGVLMGDRGQGGGDWHHLQKVDHADEDVCAAPHVIHIYGRQQAVQQLDSST